VVRWGDFTGFLGRWNYQQSWGTRPDVVFREEEHLEAAAHRRVGVDDAAHVVNQFDDELGQGIGGRRLAGEENGAWRYSHLRVVAQAVVEHDGVQDVEELAFVLVDALRTVAFTVTSTTSAGRGTSQGSGGPARSRAFDLIAVVDLLAKDAIMVAQAIADRRDLQGHKRIETPWIHPDTARDGGLPPGPPFHAAWCVCLQRLCLLHVPPDNRALLDSRIPHPFWHCPGIIVRYRQCSIPEPGA
jgi:hypothetical protein